MVRLEVRNIDIGWDATPLLIGRRGSLAHGTYMPPTEPTSIDDEDWFCVAKHTPEFYVGLPGYQNLEDNATKMEQPLDIVVYDVRKFVHLLLKGNPNVHAWLWASDKDYRHISHPDGRFLLDNKRGFLSKNVLTATGGYAKGQIHRMTHFGEYHGDMGEKRKRLVDEFGYDVKNASHCIRLLWMGIQLALHEEFIVRLPLDIADLCKKIKRGEYSLTDIKLMTKTLWDEFEAAEAETSLPDKPDRDKANYWLTKIILKGE